MNEYDKNLMLGPSIIIPHCVFCGLPKQNNHHIVFRSHGGEEGPQFSVCGLGNTEKCHGDLHQSILHLRWDTKGFYEYIRCKEPTKRERAEEQYQWHLLPILGLVSLEEILPGLWAFPKDKYELLMIDR